MRDDAFIDSTNWNPTVQKIMRSYFMLFSSVQSLSRVSLRSHELQHARPPCPSPTPGVYSNSCPLSWWCHPTISSSVIPFSSCLQSFPVSGSFPRSQFFTSAGQSIGAHQAFLSPTISWSLLKLMPTESVTPSNHLILCHSFLLLLSVFPSIRVFSNKSVLHVRQPKY